jgi:hypothetical protein
MTADLSSERALHDKEETLQLHEDNFHGRERKISRESEIVA